MITKVVVTVDAEPSIAGAFESPESRSPRIHEPVWGEVGGKSEALGFMIDTLKDYGLRATFFVETVHLSYFPETIMGGYVEKLVEGGQDVQLHLHPCWLNFALEREDPSKPISDQCSALSEHRLAELIEVGRERIAAWSGHPASSLRTGNFSASRSVYRAMKAAGLKLASNVCVGVVAPAADMIDPEQGEAGLAGGLHDFEGVTEVPVTCFKDVGPVGRGRLRPLQVTACGSSELCSALTTAQALGCSTVVIVTHPFEFLKWSGDGFDKLRPNRLVQKRFQELCRFLSSNPDRFEVVPMADFENRAVKAEPAPDLRGRPHTALRRAMENFVNDRLPV